MPASGAVLAEPRQDRALMAASARSSGWRRRAELNRGTRICNGVGSHRRRLGTRTWRERARMQRVMYRAACRAGSRPVVMLVAAGRAGHPGPSSLPGGTEKSTALYDDESRTPDGADRKRISFRPALWSDRGGLGDVDRVARSEE